MGKLEDEVRSAQHRVHSPVKKSEFDNWADRIATLEQSLADARLELEDTETLVGKIGDLL